MPNTIPNQGSSTPPQAQPETRGARPKSDSDGALEQAAQLIDKAAHSADDTAKKAIERAQETREQVRSGLEAQQTQLSGRIRDVGDALRSSGRKLADSESVSSLFTSASEQADRLASYVDTASPRTVASDLHNFARDKPAWFFGGAFIAGLALGRFAKSSARASAGGGNDYEAQRSFPVGRSTSAQSAQHR